MSDDHSSAAAAQAALLQAGITPLESLIVPEWAEQIGAGLDALHDVLQTPEAIALTQRRKAGELTWKQLSIELGKLLRPVEA